MTSFKITQLSFKDLDNFVLMFNRLLISCFPEFSPKVKKYFMKDKQDFFTKAMKQKQIILIAWDNKKMIGFLITDIPVGGISFCDWLAVDGSYRNQSVGTLLLKEWEKIAKKQGIHNLRLESFKRNNDFYKRQGFTLVGFDKQGFWGTDNYIFKKNIQNPKEEKFCK